MARARRERARTPAARAAPALPCTSIPAVNIDHHTCACQRTHANARARTHANARTHARQRAPRARLHGQRSQLSVGSRATAPPHASQPYAPPTATHAAACSRALLCAHARCPRGAFTYRHLREPSRRRLLHPLGHPLPQPSGGSVTKRGGRGSLGIPVATSPRRHEGGRPEPPSPNARRALSPPRRRGHAISSMGARPACVCARL